MKFFNRFSDTVYTSGPDEGINKLAKWRDELSEFKVNSSTVSSSPLTLDAVHRQRDMKAEKYS